VIGTITVMHADLPGVKLFVLVGPLQVQGKDLHEKQVALTGTHKKLHIMVQWPAQCMGHILGLLCCVSNHVNMCTSWATSSMGQGFA
jgi:hypothetical protein